LNLFWFNFLFLLISKNNMNTCTYVIHTLSLIYAMKLLVIFGIKIYQKLPSYLTISRFLSIKPPTFTYAEEPMDADDWLATIESKLEVARCEGRDRVLFAAHQLQGAAKEWWTAYTTAHEYPQGIYWQEFRRSFRAHYVPSGEI